MSPHDAQLDAFRKLIATAEPPLLGPQPRPGTKSIEDVNGELRGFFQREKIAVSAQELLSSAALLWHDHLDASHTISQSIETRDGSWLHAIMHRREADYGNAKYWFRRVGQHNAFPKLAERVAKFLHNDRGGLTEHLIENGEWMPFAFVDECERAEATRDENRSTVLRGIQTLEFDTLVENILSH